MATPSEGELQNEIRAAVDLLEETRKFASVNADNWVALEDVLTATVKTDLAAEWLSAIRSLRLSLNAVIGPAGAAAALSPLILEYGSIIDAPERDVQKVLERLYDYFIANSKTIKSRTVTFGTPTFTTGVVGNGVIHRLTVDENNLAIEAVWADTYTAEVVEDQSLGRFRHEEKFELRGTAPYKDDLKETGSGVTGSMTAQSANQSLLSNPSFSSYTKATYLSDVTDWTFTPAIAGTGADIDVDTTNYYRAAHGDTSPTALTLKQTFTITQKLSVANITLKENLPYFLGMAWNRQVGSGVGSLELHLGTKSTTVAVSAQSGWQLLYLPITYQLWYKNFLEDEIDVKMVWTRTSGNLLIDEVLLLEFMPFAGTYLCAVGGTTPWMRRDKATWSDTLVDSKIQRWLWKGFGRYLPHSGSPSIVDP